jgi:hypothetical protein
MNDRRRFLQTSATLFAGAHCSLHSAKDPFAFLKIKIMPNDQLNIGAIGINGMGWSNLRAAVKFRSKCCGAL